MKEINAESVWQHSQAAIQVVHKTQAGQLDPACIGLDVHKETIA